MIITAKYGSHHFTDYGENAILAIFPLWDYGRFLLPRQQNKLTDHHKFSYVELPLPKQHLYKISHKASMALEELSFIFFFFKFNVAIATKPNDHWSANT